jgi:hypothetical protein
MQVTGSASNAEEAILRAIEAVRNTIGGAYNPSKLTIQAIATSAECLSISFEHN